MPRSVNSTILTALLADEVKLFYAVDLDFYNGSTSTAAPVYFWTGVGDLSAKLQYICRRWRSIAN